MHGLERRRNPPKGTRRARILLVRALLEPRYGATAVALTKRGCRRVRRRKETVDHGTERYESNALLPQLSESRTRTRSHVLLPSTLRRFNDDVSIPNRKGAIMDTGKTFAEQIAAEYSPKGTSKVVALRKLDNHAKHPAVATAFTLGIASAHVIGIGMCLSMGIVGSASTSTTIVGVAIEATIALTALGRRKGMERWRREAYTLRRRASWTRHFWSCCGT